jgi:hypothetical protein
MTPKTPLQVVRAISVATLWWAGPAVASGGTGVVGADLTRSAVTNLPAYNVDESNSSKTHTLFMGADIAVNLDKDFCRVLGVVGSSWVVDSKGRERVISAKEGPLKMRITPVLKLTEASAWVERLTDLQAFSFDNDPTTRLTRAVSRSAALNADYQYAANQASAVVDGTARLVRYAQLFNQAHPDAYLGGVGTDMSRLNNMNHVANENQLTQVGSPGRDISIDGKAIQPAGLDAMDIEFDVRSGRMLQHPYVVTFTKFREKDAKPGLVHSMIYAQELHPIDEHQEHVHFVEDGFPAGFEALDFRMHIYNGAEEIATNVSENRVELTREEAFEYVKMEYIGSHIKDTLPAVPVMGRFPSDLRSLIAQGKYRDTVYVIVSKEGLADEAYVDAACTRRSEDPYLQEVVRSIRFKPALDGGKPVRATAALDLAKLPI